MSEKRCTFANRKKQKTRTKKMGGTSTNVQKREVILPTWLDKLIFNDLSAKYCPANKDMVVLNWSQEEINGYLGTYFPRSYAESYCIFTDFLSCNKTKYTTSDELTVFDFGCGTGGELVGFIVAAAEQLPRVKRIVVRALDGNQYALRLLECILEEISKELDKDIECHPMPLVIDDFYDMKIVTDAITQSFDFVISFKAICEFVTRQQFENKNPYTHIINEFMPKLSDKGVICIADITSYNETSQDWLPKMLDKASTSCNVEILCRNCGFNEEYRISHSRHANDISKIAWRIYQK